MEVKGLMAPTTMNAIDDRVESLRELALEEFWIEAGDYTELDFRFATTIVELLQLKGMLESRIKDVTNTYEELVRAARQDGF